MKKEQIIKFIREELEKQLMVENPQLQSAAAGKFKSLQQALQILQESYLDPDADFPTPLGTADRSTKQYAKIARKRLEEFLKIAGGGSL